MVDYVVINVIKKKEEFWNKDFGEDLTGFVILFSLLWNKK